MSADANPTSDVTLDSGDVAEPVVPVGTESGHLKFKRCLEAAAWVTSIARPARTRVPC